MKNLLIIILLVVITILSFGHYPVPNYAAALDSIEPHRMIEEIVINYDTADYPYKRSGTYKEIYRKYNYGYFDSTYLGEMLDDMHERDYYINECGDTVLIIYTDLTNFPRREE